MKSIEASIEVVRAEIVAYLPPSRERSLALTKLEECDLWMDKADRLRLPHAAGPGVANESTDATASVERSSE